MKFKIHFFLFLIWIAITAAKGQTQIGTIRIDGQELPIYINQPDVDKIVTRLKTPTVGAENIQPSQPVVTQPIVIPTSGGTSPITINQRTLITPGKAQFQASSHSFGLAGTINGQQLILSKAGQKILEVSCNDNEILPGGHPSNNHMNGYNIVIPVGSLDIYYKNSTLRNHKILLGAAEIHNNEGYIFYRNPATGIFAKELAPGEAFNTTINIEDKNDFGQVAQFADGTLHKQVNFNLYQNGSIHPAIYEMAYWRQDQYYEYQAGYYQPCNTTFVVTIRNKNNPSENITLSVETFGYGQTGAVTVLNKNNLDITEAGSRISSYNFNHNYFENGRQQYNIREGIKHVTYKMYNNYPN